MIACLVAKGYTQTYSIVYDQTFYPVANISLVCVLISLAANLDWPSFQLDVKNAFLLGDYTGKFIWSNHSGLLLRRSIKVVSVS
jgi:hypothetical protein